MQSQLELLVPKSVQREMEKLAKMKSMLKKWRQQHPRYLFWSTYGILVILAAVLGGLGGMLLGYSIDLPQVEELQKVRPNVVSYVYSADGEVLGEFALEKRILVTYDQIPETLKQAILAAEDSDFFEHSGIDFQRAFVTIGRNILYGQRKGASTLTMQLCKLRFTSSEKRLERKIKDILFAIETEKKFSKEQIFTLYFNQIYMGHGIYGIAAAADFYLNKNLDQLTLAESALLAGVLNVPERYSPIRHPERALQRRAYALRRMHDEGYITEQQMQEAMDEPIRAQGNTDKEIAPYFVEWVRQQLERNYPTEKIWKGGLKIYTTLDSRMQKAANAAIRKGLMDFDKRTVRWKGASENVLESGGKLEDYYHPEWRQIFREDQLVHGLVTEVSPEKAAVKLGSYTAELLPEGIQWTRKKKPSEALKVGDVAVFRLSNIDHRAKTVNVQLDRIPEAQGAFLVLDNRTGATLAMVGGFDFQYSQFNRATQALRQPGSIFKPFTYLVALEEGKSPFEKLLDAPVNFVDELGRPYEPKNSDGEYKGLIPLQQALAESRNVPTLRLAKALGIRKIIAMAQRFGIQRQFVPVLPIALGAGEITLEEITSAFSVFGNRGVRAKPYFLRRVEDYNGFTLEEHQTEFEHVISPAICSKMLYLLRQVVQRGTAVRARAVNRPIVGKTGTTNEATDTWFVGLTPDITAGVWVGYDEKRSLGEEVYGSNMALPIWVDFMTQVDDIVPRNEFEDIYQPTALDMVLDTTVPEEKLREIEDISIEDIPAVSAEDLPPNVRPDRPPAEY